MIQSDVMTYLYDPLVGGPPRAYECKLVTGLGYSSEKVCGFVCRTLRGIRMHQLYVHDFKPQAKLLIRKEEQDAQSNRQ